MLLTKDNAYVNRTKKTFQTACKPCGKSIAKNWHAKNKEHELARRKKYYKENKARITETTERNRIKRKYGISTEELASMTANQGTCCAICGESTKLVIDHCHKSGKVRELLCSNCNTALGMVKDDVGILQACINYLERHNDS